MKPARSERSSVSAASPENSNITQVQILRGEMEGGGEGLPGEKSRRESSSAVIQRNWREHRERVCRTTPRNEGMKQTVSESVCVKDTVMLQSAFRGHLSREAQLTDVLEEQQNKVSATQTFHMGKRGRPLFLLPAEEAFLSLCPPSFTPHPPHRLEKQHAPTQWKGSWMPSTWPSSNRLSGDTWLAAHLKRAGTCLRCVKRKRGRGSRVCVFVLQLCASSDGKRLTSAERGSFSSSRWQNRWRLLFTVCVVLVFEREQSNFGRDTLFTQPLYGLSQSSVLMLGWNSKILFCSQAIHLFKVRLDLAVPLM